MTALTERLQGLATGSAAFAAAYDAALGPWCKEDLPPQPSPRMGRAVARCDARLQRYQQVRTRFVISGGTFDPKALGEGLCALQALAPLNGFRDLLLSL